MLRSYESHPVRGAWIEMKIVTNDDGLQYRRTPAGVRGLKLLFCCRARIR